MEKADDALSMQSATRIAKRIRDYWFERGHIVNVWIEPTGIKLGGLKKQYRLHQVRSNLTNGLPVDQRCAR